MSKAQAIDQLLPQTQCGLCGYAGCRPYAEALAAGTTTINLCQPGGVATIRALGAFLNVDATAYEVEIQNAATYPELALIREEECIGCTKCIQACPVDAIIGSAKAMHHIVAHECTGCGLCVEPCPVDCIEMTPVENLHYSPDLARARYEAKKIRALAKEHEQAQNYRDKKRLAIENNDLADKIAKKAYILEAMARSKSK